MAKWAFILQDIKFIAFYSKYFKIYDLLFQQFIFVEKEKFSLKYYQQTS